MRAGVWDMLSSMYSTHGRLSNLVVVLFALVTTRGAFGQTAPPSTQPIRRPASRPTLPASRPTGQPLATRPATRPATTRPVATRPATQPAKPILKVGTAAPKFETSALSG